MSDQQARPRQEDASAARSRLGQACHVRSAHCYSGSGWPWLALATHLTLPTQRLRSGSCQFQWLRSACHENLGSGPSTCHGTGSSRPIIETTRALYGSALDREYSMQSPTRVSASGNAGALADVQIRPRGSPPHCGTVSRGRHSRHAWELFVRSPPSHVPVLWLQNLPGWR